MVYRIIIFELFFIILSCFEVPNSDRILSALSLLQYIFVHQPLYCIKLNFILTLLTVRKLISATDDYTHNYCSP